VGTEDIASLFQQQPELVIPHFRLNPLSSEISL
jgi:hypothetical protein